jgi:hypothetical protein
MNMSERGRLGGIARNGTTMAQHRLDVEECQAYLAAHPGATVYDVSLELHYSTEAARRIMRAAYQNQIIMVLGTGGASVNVSVATE